MVTVDQKTENLKKAQARLAEMRATGEEIIVRRTPAERLEANPTSLRRAIDAKCFDCIGADDDPCYQWRIGNCGVPGCPLYAVRPYQSQYGKPVPASLKAVDD